MFGKVDVIEGLGHVATEFGHIFWIPLVPKETMLVTSKKWNGVEGVPLKMSMKSVLAGYARAFAIFMVIAAFGAAKLIISPEPDTTPERLANMKIMLAIGAFALPALLISYSSWFNKAEYETAIAIVDQAGLDYPTRVLVDLQYGKIDEDEAVKRIEQASTDNGLPQFDEDFEFAANRYPQHAEV